MAYDNFTAMADDNFTAMADDNFTAMADDNFTAMADDNFTASTAPTPTGTRFDYALEVLAYALNGYYTPALIFLGCIGNMISLFVFFASKLRMQSTSLYLSALAISDTIFLLQLLPPWLKSMQITNLFHRPGFCQIFVYSTYSSCCLSVWLVVAFTVERYVAVLYPLRRSRMCTVARAKTVIGLLVVGALLTNLPVGKYASPSRNSCNIALEYMEHAAWFNVADTVLSFSLPLGLIVLLNIRIACGLWRRECNRRVMQAALAVACNPPPRALPPLRSQHRVTRMLLIVSTVFVVLNLPAYTMRLLVYAYDMSSGEYSGRWAALQQLALMFFNTNFGINFILYCVTGQNFRRELWRSMPCLRVMWHSMPCLRELCRYLCCRRRRARPADDIEFVSRNAGRAGSVTMSYVSAGEASTSVNVDCRRRRDCDPYIERWTIDNRRALRAFTLPTPTPEHAPPHAQEIEMQDLAPVMPAFPPAISQLRDARSDEEVIESPPIDVLFPKVRLSASRKRLSTVVDLTDNLASGSTGCASAGEELADSLVPKN